MLVIGTPQRWFWVMELLPSGQGVSFFFCHHSREATSGEEVVSGAGGVTIDEKGAVMIWARAPCSSSTDVNLDKTEDATEWGPWQGWHFKVWTHWGQSSGRPGTAEEVSLGQSCDTLFGSISREQTAPCGSSTVMRKAASLLGCIRLGRVSIVWKDKAEKPYLWRSSKK